MLGIINLNKPTGKTSHDMVSFVRRTLGIKRVGHAGTLDPDASGVLPILVGKATLLSDLLTEKNKTYQATVRLGIETDTYDITGQITATNPYRPREEEIRLACQSFLGEISQLPPMYSAVKMNGKKLYELARQGMVIERKPRRVTIAKVEPYGFLENEFSLEVQCSKGTYIRSLCHDLGKKMGTCACMGALVRTQSGPFFLENACTPEELVQATAEGQAERFLLPPDVILGQYPAVTVTEAVAGKLKQGIRMRPEQLGVDRAKEHDIFRIYFDNNLFSLVRAIYQNGTLVLAIEKNFFE